MRIRTRSVCLVVPLVLLIAVPLHAQGRRPRNDHESCRAFVQDFYDNWAGVEFALKYRPRFLSPPLFRALKGDVEAQSRVEGEIGGLDFDAFRGGQDPGDRYFARAVRRKGASYWVDVHGRNVGGARGLSRNPDVVAEVVRERGRWVFVNFHFYGDEGGKRVPHGDLLSALGGRSEGSQATDPLDLQIGLVDNSTGQYQDGCGCGFWPAGAGTGTYPKDQNLVLIGDGEKRAWMSVDGQVVELRLVTDTVKYRGAKGDRYVQKYRSGDVTVDVDCTATGFGDTHAVDLTATLTVRRGSRVKTMKAVGSCGC
jgi:hypothetical protein